MKKTRIMIFGTFDGLHKGHLNLFKQARRLADNPYLIVSIGRDVNVKKIKKYKPEFTETERFALVKKSRLVNKVVLAGINNYSVHILKENPEIIALGYDQKHYVKNLEKDLKSLGLIPKIIRLKPYKENLYKNSILKKINKGI